MLPSITRFLRPTALTGGLIISAVLASAAEFSPRGTWFVSVDNDVFSNSDDHYTNGAQLGWVSGYLRDYADGPLPRGAAEPISRLPGLNDDNRQRFISYSLSHRIFTPEDIDDPNYIPGDVPYSGLLFASLTTGAQDDTQMHAFTFTAGVVGPAALGEQVQNNFHELIGADTARGWDNQLRNEPLLNVAYEHRRRLLTFGSRDGWGGDIIGQVGGTLGNLVTMATLGVGSRIGWNVPDDYGIPPQFFGEETIGSRPYTRTRNHRFVAWFFTLVNASAFANAIFWDGNTFKDSPSVDYDRGIGRFYFGLTVRYDAFSATIAGTATTIPWENPSNRSSQAYGRIGLAYTY